MVGNNCMIFQLQYLREFVLPIYSFTISVNCKCSQLMPEECVENLDPKYIFFIVSCPKYLDIFDTILVKNQIFLSKTKFLLKNLNIEVQVKK